MPESGQALLFDKTRNTHVVVEVGMQIAGYSVDAIDQDQVTLTGHNTQIVLSAPERAQPVEQGAQAIENPYAEPDTYQPMPVAPRNGPPVRQRAPSANQTAPVDPYAGESVGWGEDGVESPAAGEPGEATPVEVTPQPVEPQDPMGTAYSQALTEDDQRQGPQMPPYNSNVQSRTPDSRTPQSRTPDSRTPQSRTPGSYTPESRTPDAGPQAMDNQRMPDTGAPGQEPSPQDVRTPMPMPDTGPQAPYTGPHPGGMYQHEVVISRTEVDQALEDFHGLLGSIRGSFTNAGVRIEQIAPGSLFAQAGLRAGDVVTSVDGRPLRTLDDTAELYARVSTARNVTVQVIRGGKPTTLNIAIGIVPR